MKAFGSTDRIFEYLELRPLMNISGGIQIEKKDFHGLIEFKNVTFSYPARADVPILKNFTLDLRPNEVTALVGPSGSGKTTVTQLV